MNERPTRIQASRSQRLVTIDWPDGHVSRYPFGLLRAGCPCVTCRGGHEQMGPEPDPSVFQRVLPEGAATRLQDIQAVGSYALMIVWEDGHTHGIYNWHYLRGLCPCDQCQAAK